MGRVNGSPPGALAGTWAKGVGVVHLIFAFALAGLGVTAMVVARAQGGDWQGVGILIGQVALGIAAVLAVLGFSLVLATRRVRAGSRGARLFAMGVLGIAAVLPVVALGWVAAGNSPGIDAILLSVSGLAAWVIPHGVAVVLLSRAGG